MDSYRSRSGEWLVELVAIVIVCLLLGFLWYRVLTKMGYTGAARWVLLVAAFLPVTALLELIWFAFVPWPSLKEFRELKKRVESLKNIGYNPLDPELDKLREQMNKKVDS